MRGGGNPLQNLEGWDLGGPRGSDTLFKVYVPPATHIRRHLGGRAASGHTSRLRVVHGVARLAWECAVFSRLLRASWHQGDMMA